MAARFELSMRMKTRMQVAIMMTTMINVRQVCASTSFAVRSFELPYVNSGGFDLVNLLGDAVGKSGKRQRAAQEYAGVLYSQIWLQLFLNTISLQMIWPCETKLRRPEIYY